MANDLPDWTIGQATAGEAGALQGVPQLSTGTAAPLPGVAGNALSLTNASGKVIMLAGISYGHEALTQPFSCRGVVTIAGAALNFLSLTGEAVAFPAPIPLSNATTVTIVVTFHGAGAGAESVYGTLWGWIQQS